MHILVFHPEFFNAISQNVHKKVDGNIALVIVKCDLIQLIFLSNSLCVLCIKIGSSAPHIFVLPETMKSRTKVI